MSWVFLPEPGADCSHRDCWAGVQLEQSRSTPIASACWPNDSATGLSSPSLSGMTSEPLTAPPGAAAPTSSAGASLARTSAQPAGDKDWTALARASGLKCCALLAKFNLHGSLPKTPRIFVDGASIECSGGLPRWGMMLAGVSLELMMSVRRIVATDCGSWPTPTASMGQHGWSVAKKRDPRRQSAAVHDTVMAEVASRLDRCRAAGNGQVPAVAALAWEVLSQTLLEARDA